jgi:hypothetical protein
MPAAVTWFDAHPSSQRTPTRCLAPCYTANRAHRNRRRNKLAPSPHCADAHHSALCKRRTRRSRPTRTYHRRRSAVDCPGSEATVGFRIGRVSPRLGRSGPAKVRHEDATGRTPGNLEGRASVRLMARLGQAKVPLAPWPTRWPQLQPSWGLRRAELDF